MPKPVRINEIGAHINMTGRCETCNKGIRRTHYFTAQSVRALIDTMRAYNESHPFFRKAHRPRSTDAHQPRRPLPAGTAH